MHHYRCQNVYISSTVNERIVDTLKFFPHNYQMPKLPSTDRLIMAVNDMTDALQNPHPEVPFAKIENDTVSALAELAAIFKFKSQQTPAATLQTALLKVIQRP
jgi:predicted RNase H-like nuclease